MPDHIRELLHRNLQEVFGEGNAARRRAAIESLYTEDCVLYAPPGIFVGPDPHASRPALWRVWASPWGA